MAGGFFALPLVQGCAAVLGYTHGHRPAHRHRHPPHRPRRRHGGPAMTADERTRLLYLLRYGRDATEKQAARDQLTDRRAR